MDSARRIRTTFADKYCRFLFDCRAKNLFTSSHPLSTSWWSSTGTPHHKKKFFCVLVCAFVYSLTLRFDRGHSVTAWNFPFELMNDWCAGLVHCKICAPMSPNRIANMRSLRNDNFSAQSNWTFLTVCMCLYTPTCSQ